MTASPAMTGSKHQRGVAGNVAGELLVGGREGKDALISAPLLWQQSALGCRGAEMDL